MQALLRLMSSYQIWRKCGIRSLRFEMLLAENKRMLAYTNTRDTWGAIVGLTGKRRSGVDGPSWGCVVPASVRVADA